jgi:two-component system cell cycle sensor histidine kinase/response regulator CckA
MKGIEMGYPLSNSKTPPAEAARPKRLKISEVAMGGWEAGAPEIEDKRLAVLHGYQVLDTPEEAAFDRITELAARIFQAPIAVVSFVDQERQWFKSHFGLNIAETSRDISFCTHTILSEQVMVVGDATKDGRFRHSPTVVASCKIRFYAGAPLITPEGFRLGALAIMDTRPRGTFTEEERASLADLAGVVMHELNMQQELARAAGSTFAEGEAKFHALMESASQAIVAINHKGFIEVVNNKAEELFGYTRHELIGHSLEMLVPEALRKRHAGHRKDYFSRPRARPMGIGLGMAGKRKNGQEFPIEISLNYVEVGGQALAISFITDISERIRLEQQLRQSQKMEAVGQLAGGVAHDFNNLLTVIQGYSAMALEGLQADDAFREPLEEIERASASAASLTRQLLAFSRRQVIRPKVLNLNTVIKQTEKMLRRVISEDIELTMAFGERIDHILADPGLIEQIVMNLAINARDAMPEGGKLTIETANLFLDKEYVGAHLAIKTGPHAMLAVTDTGTGLSAEVRAHIFEPFYTTKPQGKGTGLGLATVFGIVQQLEGTIWVYSEPGNGTVFKIFFPIVEADAKLEQAASEERVGSGGQERILLVEDEDGVRKFVHTMLEKQGYTVLEAADSEDALSLVAHSPDRIDLLLTDVIMPRMNGPELAERITRLRPGLGVLFMSGYTDRTIRLQEGFGDESNFIQKPFTPNSLAQRLRELLGKSATEQGQA